MDNYFELPNVSSLKCYIEGYGPTFPILSVYASGIEADYFLVFVQPAYVNAPMSWTGADFSLADVGQREKLALQLASTPEGIKNYRDQLTLFVAEIDKATPYPKRIEILALYAKVEEKKR